MTISHDLRNCAQVDSFADTLLAKTRRKTRQEAEDLLYIKQENRDDMREAVLEAWQSGVSEVEITYAHAVFIDPISPIMQ